MRKVLLPLLLFLSVSVNAQLLKDINGRPYLNTVYDEYEGNPMLFTDWTKATVRTADGQVYEGMMINVDTYKDVVLFMRDNQVLSFLENIVEFTAMENGQNVTYTKGSGVDSKLPDGFYKVIQSDPLFIRSTRKTLSEMPGYGSNTKKKFLESKFYYARIGTDVQRVSMTKGDAEKLFAAKWKAVSAYAATNGLSFKNEAAWQALLAQYNAL